MLVRLFFRSHAGVPLHRPIIQHYLSKVSGPPLDRIDLHVEVPTVPYKELRAKDSGTGSAEMRQRVENARAIQSELGFYVSTFPPPRSGDSAHWTMPANERWRWRCDRWGSAPGRRSHLKGLAHHRRSGPVGRGDSEASGRGGAVSQP